PFSGSISDVITILEKNSTPPVSTDVIAALTVIGRRKHKHAEPHRLDLSNSDFSNIKLPRGSDFRKADFSHSNLYNTKLDNCDFEGVEFYGAVLYLTSFKEAILNNVSIRDSQLIHIFVEGAYLNGFAIAERDIKSVIGISETQKAKLEIWRQKRDIANASGIVGPASQKWDE
ncbi:pentapeptide repeat-containing protein, partial [bacterium]|nr:pentapeptide repeat-containing protein [bacterium]